MISQSVVSFIAKNVVEDADDIDETLKIIERIKTQHQLSPSDQKLQREASNNTSSEDQRSVDQRSQQNSMSQIPSNKSIGSLNMSNVNIVESSPQRSGAMPQLILESSSNENIVEKYNQRNAVRKTTKRTSYVYNPNFDNSQLEKKLVEIRNRKKKISIEKHIEDEVKYQPLPEKKHVQLKIQVEPIPSTDRELKSGSGVSSNSSQNQQYNMGSSISSGNRLSPTKIRRINHENQLEASGELPPLAFCQIPNFDRFKIYKIYFCKGNMDAVIERVNQKTKEKRIKLHKQNIQELLKASSAAQNKRRKQSKSRVGLKGQTIRKISDFNQNTSNFLSSVPFINNSSNQVLQGDH